MYKDYEKVISKHIKKKYGEIWLERENDRLYSNYGLEGKQYQVVVRGPGIENFKKDMMSRMREIKRCIPGISIDEISSYEDNKSIIIKTLKADSFKKLKNQKTWPTNAFKDGIKVEYLPTHIELKINDFDKSRAISPNNELYHKLNEAGFAQASRVKRDDKEKNQIKGYAKSLAHLVEIMKNKGIEIETNNEIKKFKVEICFKYTSPCNKCGSLQHNSRYHSKENSIKCIRCSDNGHTMDNCMSDYLKCANCHKSHQSDDERCQKLREKIYELNSYILKILLTEKIINKREEILRNKTEIDLELLEGHNVINIINNRLEEYTTEINEKHNTLLVEQKKLTDRVVNNELKAEHINKKIDNVTKELNKKIDASIENIDKKISIMNSEVMNCKNSVSKLSEKMDNMNENVSQITSQITEKMRIDMKENNKSLMDDFMIRITSLFTPHEQNQCRQRTNESIKELQDNTPSSASNIGQFTNAKPSTN